MKEAFVDLDENDLKFIDIELPPDLSKLIELDGETGELKINKNVQSMGELPKGMHKIGVRMKDSSGIMGDRSGFASGIVQIIITASGSNIGGALGIDLLNTVDKNYINSILSKQK